MLNWYLQDMPSGIRSALVFPLVALVLLSGCSSADTFEYDSSDRALPSPPADWNYSYSPEDTGLHCRTNIIKGFDHEFSGNTIVSTDEFDAALVGASLQSDAEGAEFAFYLAPNKPHGPSRFYPNARMVVESQGGFLYTYEYEDGDFTATGAKGGEELDLSVLIDTTIGGSRGYLNLQLPTGVLTEDDPLKYVELTLNDQLLGRCEPVEGRNIYPQFEEENSSDNDGDTTSIAEKSTGDQQLDAYIDAMDKAGIPIKPGGKGTYTADTRTCELMRSGEKTAWDLASNERLSNPDHENARRVQVMVPVLCPDQQPVIDEALSGAAIQTELTDGKFMVRQQPEEGMRVVQPGLWQTKKNVVSDCYYERNDGAGNIIENNFVTYGEKLQVEILPTDGAFVSQSCGGWERIN